MHWQPASWISPSAEAVVRHYMEFEFGLSDLCRLLWCIWHPPTYLASSDGYACLCEAGIIYPTLGTGCDWATIPSWLAGTAISEHWLCMAYSSNFLLSPSNYWDPEFGNTFFRSDTTTVLHCTIRSSTPQTPGSILFTSSGWYCALVNQLRFIVA